MVNLIYLMKNKYRTNLNKTIKILLNSKYYMTDIIIKKKDVNLFLQYINLYTLKNFYRNSDISFEMEQRDNVDANSYMYVSSYKNKCITFSYLDLDVEKINQDKVLIINRKHIETIKYCLMRGEC